MELVRLVLALLCVAAVSEAHIKLFYNPWQLPIRNAPSAFSDGVFSAAANQVCGGSNQWGRDGQRRYAHVVDGQKICTRVNWNGGHSTTVNENKLRALFRCGRPANQQDFLQEAPITLSTDSIPAPAPGNMFIDGRMTNALYDGYTVCVDLPPQNIQTSSGIDSGERQCTLAIVEGNNWGGCHDLLLYPNEANGGTQPLHTPAPVMSATEYNQAIASNVNLTAAEATYRLENCFTDTGGKCCLIGYFAVRNNGAVSARIRGNPEYNVCFELSWGNRDYQMILRPSKFSKDLFEANFILYMGYDTFGRKVTDQNMSLTLRDGGSMFISNVGLDVPEVADHDIIRLTTLEDGLAMGLVPWPNYTNSSEWIPWDWIIAGIVGGSVLIYLLGGVILSKLSGGPCHHPHIHGILVCLGCVRKRRKKNVVNVEDDTEKPIQARPVVSKPKSGFSLQLPPDWSSAIDPMSGEVYYFNSKTKQTTWTRPT